MVQNSSDSTDQERTVEDWRELFPAAEVEVPRYAGDLVGQLERFDERDCVFARRDLRPGGAPYEAYYRLHPERKLVDDEIRAMPEIGSREPAANGEMFRSLFASIMPLGSPEVVEGGRLVGTPYARPGSRVELAPLVAAEKVRGFARLLGADLVGIGPLNPAFVYSHIGRTFYGETWGEPIRLDHPYAISLGIRMNTGGLVRTSPHFPTLLESGLAYARGAFISVQLASYIRGLGYRARAHHLRNYQVLSVPVAVDGGLGEMGRCGFLLTREYGNCLRLATVTTDLPMALDKPTDLGVERFCERCVACVKACPAGAIPTGEKTVVRGVRKWALDAAKCYHFWHEMGSDCGLCIAACPWSNWALGPRPSETEPPVAGSYVRSASRPQWLR
ncbi:MAG: 4Fe-4S dicluster domain-containing protein [Chloroflexota bacterium]